MKFENTENFITEKIKELKLPYFKCIVTKDNKTIYSCRFSTMGNNDLLKMYSMSKPITVVALMQLQEKGLVNTDDEVSKYLPGFSNLKLKDSGLAVKTPMKIHHLLTMTSGLDYNLFRPAVLECSKANNSASTLDIASCFAKDGILFEPGSMFNYSLSMDVVAAIVEVVSKMKFSEYVKRNIFDPLGMKHSTFRNDKSYSNKAIEDFIYQNGKLEKSPGNHEYFTVNDTYESGGAGLVSTVEDYSLFISSLACDERLLFKESIEKMAKIYVENTPFNKDVEEYSKSSEDYGYGYGVRVRKHDSSFGIPKGEFGWDGAAGSYCMCDRKNGISLTVGLNVLGWPTYVKDFHIKLAENIYKDILKNS